MTLLCNGGGGGGGTAPVSTSASRPSSDSSAPSTLYGRSCVAPTAACSTTAIEPIRLTARFPKARVSGVSASDPGRAIAGPEVSSPPPPRGVGPLADTPGAVPLTSGRSSSSPEESTDSDGDRDGSSGRPSCLCCQRRLSNCSRSRIFLVRFATSASFFFFYASACAWFAAHRLASSGTGGGEARMSLIPCRNGERK